MATLERVCVGSIDPSLIALMAKLSGKRTILLKLKSVPFSYNLSNGATDLSRVETGRSCYTKCLNIQISINLRVSLLPE